MKTSRIFTLICIVACLTFFATNRQSSEDNTLAQSQSTTSKTDTAATEAQKSKGSAGEPLPGGKGTNSTRAKTDNTRVNDPQQQKQNRGDKTLPPATGTESVGTMPEGKRTT